MTRAASAHRRVRRRPRPRGRRTSCPTSSESPAWNVATGDVLEARLEPLREPAREVAGEARVARAAAGTRAPGAGTRARSSSTVTSSVASPGDERGVAEELALLEDLERLPVALEPDRALADDVEVPERLAAGAHEPGPGRVEADLERPRRLLEERLRHRVERRDGPDVRNRIDRRQGARSARGPAPRRAAPRACVGLRTRYRRPPACHAFTARNASFEPRALHRGELGERHPVRGGGAPPIARSWSRRRSETTYRYASVHRDDVSSPSSPAARAASSRSSVPRAPEPASRP